jgi:hypothetical protein
MPFKPAVWMRSEVLSVARDVLRRRGAISSSRGDVRGLLAEYRAYLGEAERVLERNGVLVTKTVLGWLRDEWTDALIEHQRQALPLRA